MFRADLIRTFAVIGLSLSLVACGDRAGTSADGDTTALMPPDTTETTGAAAADTPASPTSAITDMNDSNLVAKLAMMDSMEIELGRLATTKARNTDVKAFAEMMVNHHTAMKKEAQMIASREMIGPATLSADSTAQEFAREMQQLTAASDDQFDVVYMDVMARDHQFAIAELTAMANQAMSPALKSHIEKGLPQVRAHLQRVLEIQSQLNETAAAQ